MTEPNLPAKTGKANQPPVPIHNFPERARHALLATAWLYGVPAHAILGGNRSRSPLVTAARWGLIRALRTLMTPDGKLWSMPRIGRLLGLDHTSVLYALRGDLEAKIAEADYIKANAPAREADALARKRIYDAVNRERRNAQSRARYHERRARRAA